MVVNDGSQCLGETDFKEMVTHFMGHGLGFNHHTDPDATMNVNLGVHPPRGAAISTIDKTCASYAYHTFLDVPLNGFAWKFIEAIENRGVTTGCGGGKYCPNSPVTREQMAVFLIKTLEGPSYVPLPCTSDPFNDVPCAGNSFGPWVQDIADRGITAGCGGGNYCPKTANTRAQIAVFLSVTFSLPLP